MMNWLDLFSVVFMAEDDVTVTIIWHKAAVESFRFFSASIGWISPVRFLVVVKHFLGLINLANAVVLDYLRGIKVIFYK